MALKGHFPLSNTKWVLLSEVFCASFWELISVLMSKESWRKLQLQPRANQKGFGFSVGWLNWQINYSQSCVLQMDYFFQEFKGGMVGWMRPVVFLVITAGVEIATCKSAQLDSYENLCSLLFSACYTGPVCKIERKIKERFFKKKNYLLFF